MRVAVLGPLAIEASDGRLGPRDRVVLSVLVLHGAEVVGAERLADALWGDEPPASAGKVVQGCISRLRKVLGTAAIETQGTGYRLALGADDVDLHRFERLLGRAREQLALRAPDRALRTAEEALALWRGRPFDDVEGWDPARIESVRLEELRHEAEEIRVDAALRAGRHHEMLALARRLVDAAPTRERRWELLALAQYRAGSQADALRTLHEARRRLAEELGLDPGPGIVELERAILRQDTDLAGPTIPEAVDDECPWPGLLAYAIGDAEGFAGREDEVAACLDRLAAEGVVVVVGPSGSGKSSLVRAGVAAKLQRDGRTVTVITPGTRPGERLGAVPATDVLVVDQCEEVVTACDDEEQRRRFFDALVERAGWGPQVVVALRADRVGELARHAGVARLIERGLFLLGPMDEESLRAAIERPARAAGLLLEPGLVDLVVRDVLDEPGALPLMSHALQQTWSRREGRTLTVAGYNGSGGIRTAVAQSAEAVYEDVGPDDQPKLRDLLLRLVVPLEDGAPARVRLERRAIAEDPRYERLVERLVEVRLLTTDGDVVELAHEALARAWPRFQGWLADDVEGIRLLRHLGSAATGWDALGRPDSELYRGERLAGVLDWRERTDPELTALEAAFLEASVARQRADLHAAEVQVQRERRTVRRLRRLVAGVAVLAVVALVAGVAALRQRDEADDQARIAEARRIAAEALEARPHDRALLLALEAVRRSDDADTRGALLTTIGRSPRALRVFRSGSRYVDVDASPDGTQVASSDDFGEVVIRDVASGDVLRTFAADGVSFGAPTYSPDGRSVAVTWYESTCEFRACGPSDVGVDVYATDDLDGEPVTYRGLDGPPVEVAWSPDGRHLAASLPVFLGNRDSMAVWAVGAPEDPVAIVEPREPGSDFRPIPGPSLSAWIEFAGPSTLYGSGAGPVSEIDVATGNVLRELDGFGGLALGPDRSTIAVRTDPRVLELRDATSGVVLAELAGHEDAITSAAFSADGALVATGAVDETVVVWDARTGARRAVLEGHAGPVLSVVFGAGSDRLWSVAVDRTMIEWDLTGAAGATSTVAGLTDTRTGPHFDVASESVVVLSPDGGRLAVLEESIRLVDVEGDRSVELAGTDGSFVTWGAFDDDGDRFVTVDYFGRVRLWDAEDGERLASFTGLQPASNPQEQNPGNLGAVAFEPGRSAVLVADYHGTVTELDGETLEPTGRAVDLGLEAYEHPAGIRTAPDGRFAVTWSPFDDSEGTEILFGDIDDERVDRRVHVPSFGIRGAFDADGRRYAFGGFDGRVGVVDVDTGRVDGPADAVHTGPVSWLAFSPDGATLTALGFDGFLSFLDAATARPRARIQPGPVNVNGATTYAPDGRTVVLGYRDGTVLGFDADPSAWAAHACSVAGRDLTEGEWRDAFGDEPRRPTC